MVIDWLKSLMLWSLKPSDKETERHLSFLKGTGSVEPGDRLLNHNIRTAE